MGGVLVTPQKAIICPFLLVLLDQRPHFAKEAEAGMEALKSDFH